MILPPHPLNSGIASLPSVRLENSQSTPRWEPAADSFDTCFKFLFGCVMTATVSSVKRNQTDLKYIVLLPMHTSKKLRERKGNGAISETVQARAYIKWKLY